MALTGIVDDVVVFWVGDDQWHQIAAGEIVFADGEESRPLLFIIVPKEVLKVLEAGCGGRKCVDEWVEQSVQLATGSRAIHPKSDSPTQSSSLRYFCDPSSPSIQ